jgi:signal transduction histidine kinase
VRRRLVLAIAGVAGCAVLLFALPLAIVLERSYRDEELLRLQRDADAATRGIDLSSGTPDRIELPKFKGQIGIYATSGRRIRGSGPPTADSATRTALRTGAPSGIVPDGRLVVAVPLRNGEQIAGAVRAQRTQAKVVSRAHRAWLALAALGAGVVALAVLAALALGRRLARPLETLASAARRVGEGDFAARALMTNIREIDQVGTALNIGSRRIGELVSRERGFSADASHQLRTPLAALRLELETLALMAPERGSELSAALGQVDRLETTIETLLGLARGAPHGEQKVDLGRAMRALELRWRGALAADGRPLRVVIDVEPALGHFPRCARRDPRGPHEQRPCPRRGSRSGGGAGARGCPCARDLRPGARFRGQHRGGIPAREWGWHGDRLGAGPFPGPRRRRSPPGHPPGSKPNRVAAYRADEGVRTSRGPAEHLAAAAGGLLPCSDPIRSGGGANGSRVD